MGVLEIILIGFALSMDAFAVTISNMFCYPGASRARQIMMPVLFGVFQGFMPILGFYLGTIFGTFIERYAGIVTCIILGFIGGKMIWDAFHEGAADGEEGGEGSGNASALSSSAAVAAKDATSASAAVSARVTVPAGAALSPSVATSASAAVSTGTTLTYKVLVFQAIATSIDAFAVGVSLCAEGVAIWLAAPIITLTTFVCCVVALLIGKRIGAALGSKAQIVGGIVLVLIGLKALL